MKRIRIFFLLSTICHVIPEIYAGQWVSVFTGGIHTIVKKQDGSIWTCGYNKYGQLGLGTTIQINTPTQVSIGTNWLSVAGGDAHTIAIKQDGTLWAWGFNGYGQLGLGDIINRNTPTQVGTETNWASVSVGGSYTVAIKNDGTLWSWGINYFGQLGLGDTIDRNTPIQVGIDTNWTSVSCGFGSSFAIKQDGTLWAWGFNSLGQLGLGHTNSRNTPTQVGTDSNWVFVSGGFWHTIATKQDGTLWAWGNNQYGQLGHGDTTDRIIPTQIGVETNWATFSSGYYHIAAIKQDGTLWVWGQDNNYGQLGLGTTSNINTPTKVGIETNWASVSGGGNHTLAIKKNGTLWAWGDNSYGELGLGDTINRNSPIEIDIISPIGLSNLSTQPGQTAWKTLLLWSAPGDDEMSGILPAGSQFKIQYSTWTNFSDINWSTANAQITKSTNSVIPGTLVSYLITQLPSATYYFKIWHSDEEGNWSGLSNTATGYVIPDTSPPIGNPLIPTDVGQYSDVLTFSWTIGTAGDEESGIAGYYIEIATALPRNDTVVFGEDVGDVGTKQVAGGETGKRYYARVRARNGQGLYGEWSGWSDGITVDTTPPVGVCTGLVSGYSDKENGFKVVWTIGSAADDVSGIGGYWLQVGTTPAEAGGYQFNDYVGNVLMKEIVVTPNEFGAYYARVRAKNGAGLYGDWSDWSGAINVNEEKPTVQIAATVKTEGGKVSISGTAKAESTISQVVIKDQSGNTITRGIDTSGLVVNPDGTITGNIDLGEIRRYNPLVKSVEIEIIAQDKYGNLSRAGKSGAIELSPSESPVVEVYNNKIDTMKGEKVYIRYELPQDSEVRIDILGPAGNGIKKVLSEKKAKGLYVDTTWDGRDESGAELGTGLYFVKVKIGERVEVRKVVIVR